MGWDGMGIGQTLLLSLLNKTFHVQLTSLVDLEWIECL
jgi:hypothetical protein